mgnify:CR=1 FL=1
MSMLGRTIFVRQVDQIIRDVMENEVEKMKDFDDLPNTSSKILGIRMMAKALHDELQQRGD